MKYIRLFFCLNLLGIFFAEAQPSNKKINLPRAETVYGIVEGTVAQTGVYVFEGIPYAKPPIGKLRWKEPQPLNKWNGVLKADHFGPKPMQLPIFPDMQFRSEKMSEDCLYLNVWTSSISPSAKLPVLVYFHGGGLVAGDGSEKRYDGESMAMHGIVMVTINYRLGIFGFFAHPELSKESVHHASGNYGFLDQNAALIWVKNNITAFGGDPDKVTIAGQSAGSRSVSAQMASPLSKNLFRAAIGESGSIFGITPTPALIEAEQKGIAFAKAVNANSIEQLRKINAEDLLKLAAAQKTFGFGTIVDGYFLPDLPVKIYSTGLQADVPLLAGWNSAEISYTSILGADTPTVANYHKDVAKLYSSATDEVLRHYPANNDNEVLKAATDLASDRSIGFNTWKWIDLHSKTNGYPVYRYRYAHFLPQPDTASNPAVLGAPHSAEIEYALGTLSVSTAHPWRADDYKVSEIMQSYFINFIKTTNPNGTGLPQWFGLQSSIPKIMVIDQKAHSEPERDSRKYQFLDHYYYP